MLKPQQISIQTPLVDWYAGEIQGMTAVSYRTQLIKRHVNILTNRQRAPYIFQRAMLLVVLLVCAIAPLSLQAQNAQGPIYTAEAGGTVTSATVEYLRDVLQRAESANATALIITLTSNGGVLRDIRPFASELAAARVPVVVYVTPSGVDSGATGALLLSAAHLAAMAPGTSFGSSYPLAQVDQALTEQTQNLVLDSVTNQLREWNEMRGRNIDWIDQAVRDGVVLTNEQALALNPPAIDMVASDAAQLLTLLEGRSIRLADGSERLLTTLGRSSTAIAPTLWQSVRMALAEPTIAFVLLILGALAVYLEFAAPGTSVFAGVGIIMIIAALIGLFALPIQGWAMLLLFVALILMGAEFFMPVHGALATIGLVLMVVSGINLIDPAQAPGVEVTVWVIVVVALSLAAFVVFGVLLAIRIRKQPVVTGQEGMIGKLAEVRRPLDPEGMVYVEGALWRAISQDGDADVGERVRVVAMHNLQLVVKRLSDEQLVTNDER